MVSYFDQLFYAFRCENPQCGKEFEQILRGLLKTNEVTCPECGAAIDIREAKSTGDLGKKFDTASQLDKQAMKKD